MAHAFDSSLLRPQRRLVREAVIAGLADLKRSQGAYLVDVFALAVPVPTFGENDESQHFIEVCKGRSPLVAVAVGNRDFASHGTGASEWHGPIDVHVYIASASARGHMARIVGDVVSDGSDQADPGIEVMAEQVFDRLAGRYFDSATGGILRPSSERIAAFTEEYTVVEQVYQLDLVTDVNPGRDLVQVLEDIRAAHTETTADPYELPAVTEIAP